MGAWTEGRTVPGSDTGDGDRGTGLDPFLASLPPDTLPVVFGCEQLGGYEWGEVDADEIGRAVDASTDRGVRIFDTADCYGSGLSERRLGRLLRDRWDSVVVCTKFGVRLDSSGRAHYDSSPEWCRQAIVGSLRRLGVDHVHVYQLHHWDRRTPLDEVVGPLEGIRADGLIGGFGICNVPPDQIDTPVLRSCATYSNEFSLVRRQYEEGARRVVAAGPHFTPYGVLGQGLLTGKYDADTTFPDDDRRSASRYVNFTPDGLRRGMAVLELLRECAGDLGVPVPRVAVAWARTAIDRCFPIVGVKNRRQLDDAAEAARLELPADMVRRLDVALDGP